MHVRLFSIRCCVMKTAFVDLEPWEKQRVRKSLAGHDVVFVKSDFIEKNHLDLKKIECLAGFVQFKIPRQVIDKLPRLKLIATLSTGFDHIDLAYCKKKKITVCNVPVYGENTVAEFAFGLILSLSRKLYPSIKRTREDHLFKFDETLRGFDLQGKTLGVVGTGNIGKHVCRIANGFEMNVIAFDPFPNKPLAREIGFEYVDFDALLRKSDIVTLHVPYNKHTHHLINDKAIAKMKKGVYIVNTSRGGVVDTDALVRGLESGKIAGAALDVLEDEPDLLEESALLRKGKNAPELRTVLEEHVLMEKDNVIITPHNAFNSLEAVQRIVDTTTDNIIAFIKKKPQNVVRL